jgi:hypothetical protein
MAASRSALFTAAVALALILTADAHPSAGARGALSEVEGQRAAPAPRANPFETVKSLKCTFVVATHGSWKMGAPEAAIKAGGTLTMEFIDIDTAESTAMMKGVASTNDIVAQLRGWNLHFLDMRSTGGLMVTTVFGQESKDGKLKAAYTRADYLPVEIPGFASSPEISQHYGECEIGQ